MSLTLFLVLILCKFLPFYLVEIVMSYVSRNILKILKKLIERKITFVQHALKKIRI